MSRSHAVFPKIRRLKPLDLPEPPPLARRTYTLDEVAQILGLSKNTTYGAAQKGEIPGCFRIGRKWLVGRAAFDRWIETMIAEPSEPE